MAKWYIRTLDQPEGEILKEVEGTEDEVRVSVQILNLLDPDHSYVFGSREEVEA